MRFVVCGFCLVLFLGSVRADVLSPGSAGVIHTFEVQGLEKAPPGTRFFVYPTHLDAPPRQVESGRPFSFYKLHHPHLFAVTGDMLPEQMNEAFFADESLPRSDIQFDMISSVPDWQATRKIHTVYAFEGIEGNRILLTPVKEDRRDADGNEVSSSAIARSVWMLGIGALALVALLVLGVVLYRRSGAARA